MDLILVDNERFTRNIRPICSKEYILRNFSVDLNGFGGLKNYTLELYRKDWKGSTLLATVFSKGKSDEVEKLAAAELLTRIVKEDLLNYGLE